MGRVYLLQQILTHELSYSKYDKKKKNNKKNKQFTYFKNGMLLSTKNTIMKCDYTKDFV